MHYPNLNELISGTKATLSKGPIAIIMIEDDVEIDTTLRHHKQLGFATLIALMPAEFAVPADLEKSVIRVDYNMSEPGAMTGAINTLMDHMVGQWVYYCYNAEYLFYPFCETRSVVELLAFHTEERRGAMLSYVVDLYADDLTTYPNAVSLDQAFMDKSGYYALARSGDTDEMPAKERQLDFFGGLRWRYEEHVPSERRKIDRIALFRAKKGLKIRDDHTFSDEEYNTFACPWHHNITASICSFRTAKALKTNPGSRDEIASFAWHNSAPFEWHSRQLLDLGLMEPGQWF